MVEAGLGRHAPAQINGLELELPARAELLQLRKHVPLQGVTLILEVRERRAAEDSNDLSAAEVWWIICHGQCPQAWRTALVNVNYAPTRASNAGELRHPMTTTDYSAVFRKLPGLHYVADPQGKLLVMSDDLKDLLGCCPTQIREAFFDDGQYDPWFNALSCSGSSRGQITMRKADGSPLIVDHQARLADSHSDGRVILGTFQPLESEIALRAEIEVLRQVLNRPDSRVGLHVIDRPVDQVEEPRIVWMNAAEAAWLHMDLSRLVQRDTSGRVVGFSPGDLVAKDERDAVIKSVSDKFFHGRPATELRPREFCAHDGTGQPRPLPVQIKDFFIWSGPPDKKHSRLLRIVTMVVPLELPKELIQFLREKGARAPVLETLGIRGFEKVRRKSDRKIVFQYLSPRFKRDHEHLHRDWDADLTRGIGDADLYREEIAHRYNADDNTVIESGEPMQGVEPHPHDIPATASEADDEVQFLKVPSEGAIEGLSGFYWPVQQTPRIVEELLKIFRREGEDVLDDLPGLFQVIRKDGQHRFTFVNKIYATEHGKLQSEFIGKTDDEIFGYDEQGKERAQQYLRDDQAALSGLIVARYENHRSGPGLNVRPVLTVKSPIHGKEGQGIVGTQGVFFFRSDLDSLLRETRERDRDLDSAESRDATPSVFISYAHRDRDFLVGNQSLSRPIEGLELTLQKMRQLNKIVSWFDEQRTEDHLDSEIGRRIKECRIFVLFLSPAFFASRYIVETELQLIWTRKANDEGVRILPVMIKSVNYDAITRPDLQWLSGYPPHNGGNGEFRDPLDILVFKGEESRFWESVDRRIRELLALRE
jgi:PAS domain-containing protein